MQMDDSLKEPELYDFTVADFEKDCETLRQGEGSSTLSPKSSTISSRINADHMPAEITIPISVFELTVKYDKPNIRLMADRAGAVQELFAAFAPWHPQLDDMELLTTGKPTEQGVKIKIASQNASFFFGAVHCKFVKDPAVWAEADHITAILVAALEALQRATGIDYANKTSVLSLHLQPKTVQFQDILRRFIVPEILALSKIQTSAMAIVCRWPKYRITLDGSAALANGIFVQSERQFDATTSLDDIKATIFQDEQDLFRLLDVQEVES